MANFTRRSLLKSSAASVAAVSLGSFADEPGQSRPQRTHSSIGLPVVLSAHPHRSTGGICGENRIAGSRPAAARRTTKFRDATDWYARWDTRAAERLRKGLTGSKTTRSIEQAFRTNIPKAAKAGVPNVITFSGNRAGLSDDEGARNTITGLNRVKKIAEDHGVTICLEVAQQQGKSSGLYVRSHRLGRARGAGGRTRPT